MADLPCEKLIKKVKSFNLDIPIIIVSGQEDVGTAVQLLKEGIYDYIVKDDETKDRLWVSLKNLKEKVNLKQELNSLREEVQEKLKRYPFPGNVRALKAVMELASVMCSDGQIEPDDITFRAFNAVSDFLIEKLL